MKPILLAAAVVLLALAAVFYYRRQRVEGKPPTDEQVSAYMGERALEAGCRLGETGRLCFPRGFVEDLVVQFVCIEVLDHSGQVRCLRPLP